MSPRLPNVLAVVSASLLLQAGVAHAGPEPIALRLTPEIAAAVSTGKPVAAVPLAGGRNEEAVAAAPASEQTQPPEPADDPAGMRMLAAPPAGNAEPLPVVALGHDPTSVRTIDLTVEPDNLWQRIRNGFGMPEFESPLVADRQAFYLNHPAMLRQLIERGRMYLHHIVDELERRGMPTELALLPMIESAFNPMARSRAKALGMWQFIPSTGRLFNLDQNFWRDERRDIIASTAAALDYLQKLYEMHGDWHLALASYNWGENAVARAVERNRAMGRPTDYAHLDMPRETRYYLPKLQALKNIIAQPEVFGFALDALPNRPYFGTVPLPRDMDVAVAARLAEMPLDQFIALNPAYHRPLIRGDRNTQLVLPTDRIETFRANLRRHEAMDRPLSHWRTYTLKPGERLESVAARYKLSVASLAQINGIGRRMKVRPGMNLLVPGPGAGMPDTQLAHLPAGSADIAENAAGKPQRGAAAGKSRAKPTGTPLRKPVRGRPR